MTISATAYKYFICAMVVQMILVRKSDEISGNDTEIKESIFSHVFMGIKAMPNREPFVKAGKCLKRSLSSYMILGDKSTLLVL